MKNMEPIEIKTISNVLAELNTSPLMSAKFLTDFNKNQHKKWHVYKIELGHIKAQHFKGRSVPARKSRPKFDQQMKIGTAYMREKEQPGFIRIMDLSGMNNKEKLKTILKYDMEKEIKMEYLNDLANGLI